MDQSVELEESFHNLGKLMTDMLKSWKQVREEDEELRRLILKSAYNPNSKPKESSITQCDQNRTQSNDTIQSEIIQEVKNPMHRTCKIPSVRYENNRYEYEIQIFDDGVANTEYHVWRRFSDFESLSRYLEDIHPKVLQAQLPEKESKFQYFKGKLVWNDSVIEERKQIFMQFMQNLLDYPDLQEDNVLQGFLSSQKQFSDILKDNCYDETKSPQALLVQQNVSAWFLLYPRAQIPQSLQDVYKESSKQFEFLQHFLEKLEAINLQILQRKPFKQQNQVSPFNDQEEIKNLQRIQNQIPLYLIQGEKYLENFLEQIGTLQRTIEKVQDYFKPIEQNINTMKRIIIDNPETKDKVCQLFKNQQIRLEQYNITVNQMKPEINRSLELMQ